MSQVWIKFSCMRRVEEKKKKGKKECQLTGWRDAFIDNHPTMYCSMIGWDINRSFIVTHDDWLSNANTFHCDTSFVWISALGCGKVQLSTWQEAHLSSLRTAPFRRNPVSTYKAVDNIIWGEITHIMQPIRLLRKWRRKKVLSLGWHNTKDTDRASHLTRIFLKL